MLKLMDKKIITILTTNNVSAVENKKHLLVAFVVIALWNHPEIHIKGFHVETNLTLITLKICMYKTPPQFLSCTCSIQVLSMFFLTEWITV